MTVAQASSPTLRKPLRLWPGVVALTVQWLAWFGMALVYPEATPWGMVVAIYAGLKQMGLATLLGTGGGNVEDISWGPSELGVDFDADAAVPGEAAGVVEHRLAAHPKALVRAIGIDAAE